jgi:hypothetical protein
MVRVRFRVGEGKTTGRFINEQGIKGLIPVSLFSEEVSCEDCC